MRALAELVDQADPAWPLVQSWIGAATNHVEVLAASEPSRNDALIATQVTTRSPLGAVIHETGGILVEHGWLRVLGSGSLRLPRSIPAWNLGRTFGHQGERPPLLLVADDVIGGFFAVNGGALGSDSGAVYYFAPDTLAWEHVCSSYTEFLQWCFAGDLDHFYLEYRWSNWASDTALLPGDQGYLIYPFPCTDGPSLSERSRGNVPLSELYAMFVNKGAEWRRAE